MYVQYSPVNRCVHIPNHSHRALNFLAKLSDLVTSDVSRYVEGGLVPISTQTILFSSFSQ
jgi:hypothetical protein